ncbi:MAG TPA: Lrp/AsnC family transcriptional regulator [Gammaproteobacteria bacterium]|nr:Lrp/AsnC family transcriptional regulator [Gammaproteobacteria bacterium]
MKAFSAGAFPTPCEIPTHEGIIRKRVALLDSDKIGGGIMVFISIKTNEHNQDWFNQFVATVDEMSEVMGFYRLAGDVDYLMKVVVPDIASYNDFYLRLIDRLPLSNVTAGFVMEQIKDTTELPLPH